MQHCIKGTYLLLGILFLCCCWGYCQSAQPGAVERDPAALVYISKSLTAQGVSPNSPLTTVGVTGHLDRQTSADEWSKYSFSFTDSLQEHSLEYNHFIQGSSKVESSVSNHGRPLSSNSNREDTRVPARMERGAWPTYFPALLMYRIATNPSVDIRMMPPIAQDRGQIHVRAMEISSSHGAEIPTVDWYLDPTTFLPIRSLKRIPAYASGAFGATETIFYAGFQQQGGLLCPTEERIVIFGREIGRLHIEAVVLNQSVDVTAFEQLGR